MTGAAMVTGGTGFAGRHLVALLRERGEKPSAPARRDLDLMDADLVRNAVAELRPRVIFHLAASASVIHSWREPREVLRTNVETTLNVLEAARQSAPHAVVLIAGSAEVYGPPEELPVDESASLRPQNPYAVSKAACDLLAGQFADAHGMRVVRSRSFNHAGPGQSEEYVVGTLARQVAEAEVEGLREVVLRTGRVESRRDFTDVRDVVRGYLAASDLEPGVYNICSGRSVSVRDLIELLAASSEVTVRHEVDPARVRAHDVPDIRGSADKLRRATDWRPQIPLEQTVRDAVDAWRQRLA